MAPEDFLVANGAEPSADPWDLADGRTLTELLGVDVGATSARCAWRSGKLPSSQTDRLAAAAWLVASQAMQLRFEPATEKFELWRAATIKDRELTASERVALEAFIQPSFGLPSRPGPDDHVEGHVAELVWFILVREHEKPERDLRNIEIPGMHVTAPGGDGLAVYENEAGLQFRLWEIKKHTGNTGITGTIRHAYRQLDAEGARYLAQFTGTGIRYSGALRQLYARLVDLWATGSPAAGVGVSVSTSETRVPVKCFTTMHNYFPALSDEGQLEGLVSGFGEFDAFAKSVRRLVWSAL